MSFGNHRLNKVVAVALCAATFAGGLLPTVSVEAAIHRGQQQTQHERSARPQQDKAKAARPISAKSGESRQQTRQHRPEQKKTEQHHRQEQKKTEQQHRPEQKRTEQKHHQEQQRREQERHRQEMERKHEAQRAEQRRQEERRRQDEHRKDEQHRQEQHRRDEMHRREQERREEIRREEEAHRIAEQRREEELRRREERLRDRERELSYRERECYEDEDYCRRYHKHNNENNDSIIKAVLGTILIGAVLNNAGIFDRGSSRHSSRNSDALSVDYDEFEDEAEEILL